MKRFDEPFLVYLKDYKSTNVGSIEFPKVIEFMKKHFDGFDQTILSTTAKNQVLEPEFNLFLWAVLSNRIEIANLFWRLGKVNFKIIISKFQEDSHFF